MEILSPWWHGACKEHAVTHSVWELYGSPGTGMGQTKSSALATCMHVILCIRVSQVVPVLRLRLAASINSQGHVGWVTETSSIIFHPRSQIFQTSI